MQQYVINGGRRILHNYKGVTLHLFILAANRISLFVLFVLIPSWSSGRDGVTVVSSLQVALVDRAGSNPSSAIETRFNSKMDTYYNACNSAGLAFFPLVVEVLGAWQSLAQSHIKRLGKGSRRDGEVPVPAPGHRPGEGERGPDPGKVPRHHSSGH